MVTRPFPTPIRPASSASGTKATRQAEQEADVILRDPDRQIHGANHLHVGRSHVHPVLLVALTADPAER